MTPVRTTPLGSTSSAMEARQSWIRSKQSLCHCKWFFSTLTSIIPTLTLVSLCSSLHEKTCNFTLLWKTSLACEESNGNVGKFGKKKDVDESGLSEEEKCPLLSVPLYDQVHFN